MHFYHNIVSLIYKWNYKVAHFTEKKLHLVRAVAREVSHNDVVLTDVGQLFISSPESVPIGARADATHTCFTPWAGKTYWLDFGYH